MSFNTENWIHLDTKELWALKTSMYGTRLYRSEAMARRQLKERKKIFDRCKTQYSARSEYWANLEWSATIYKTNLDWIELDAN